MIMLVIGVAIGSVAFSTSKTETTTFITNATITSIMNVTVTSVTTGLIQSITVSSNTSSPATITVYGTVDGENYTPIQVSFCAEDRMEGVLGTTVSAQVAPGTSLPCWRWYGSMVQNFTSQRQTFAGSNRTYVVINGSYSVSLPNSNDYAIEVALTASHYGPSITVFTGWLPLSHITTSTQVPYNIDCFYQDENTSYPEICAGSG